MQESKVETLGRLIPDSGKIHQNQEVYNSIGGNLICTIKATHYKDPPKILESLDKNKGNNKQ